MCNSPAPLAEKMTLFWHGHFATSAEKVNSYRMWLQNETLRMYALGNFDTLVKAISCDPAMLAWLDLAASQKEHPNENFARELMELFTLGEGHYPRMTSKRPLAPLPAIGRTGRRRNSVLSRTSLIFRTRFSWERPAPGEATKLSILFSPNRNARNSSPRGHGRGGERGLEGRLRGDRALDDAAVLVGEQVLVARGDDALQRRRALDELNRLPVMPPICHRAVAADLVLEHRVAGREHRVARRPRCW